MKAQRWTAVILETQETTVIRFPQSSIVLFCEACQADKQHLSIVMAASILLLSESAIRRLALDKQIHSTQGTDGSFLLCGDSLAALTQRREKE